jgi:hypothetical protein
LRVVGGEFNRWTTENIVANDFVKFVPGVFWLILGVRFQIEKIDVTLD